jgi:hypothetical protein
MLKTWIALTNVSMSRVVQSILVGQGNKGIRVSLCFHPKPLIISDDGSELLLIITAEILVI